MITNSIDAFTVPNHISSTIGWIDDFCLTRESMTRAMREIDPDTSIIAFETVLDCVKKIGLNLDVIVYYSHDTTIIHIDDVTNIVEAFTTVPLVVISDAAPLAKAVIRDTLSNGASGVILSSTTDLRIVMSAISLVKSGGTFVPREFLMADPLLVLEEKKSNLTPRQDQVLDLLKEGKPNKLIAYELGLSEATVKVHVRTIMRKFGATNRTQAAFIALGVVEPDHLPSGNNVKHDDLQAARKPIERFPAKQKTSMWLGALSSGRIAA